MDTRLDAPGKEVSLTSLPKAIGRLAFLLRFIAVVFVMACLFAVAKLLHIYVHRQIFPQLSTLVFVIAIDLSAALGVIYTIFLFIRLALMPRLVDIGLHGPIGTVFAVLWFVPPVNPFLFVALLLVPAGFVHAQSSP